MANVTQLKHLEHIEDEILNYGVTGGRAAINFLRSLRDMMAGTSRSSVNMTVKWDGAAAVFAGIDPSDSKYYVAKKSVFNVNPKLYKTNAEIDADLSGTLNSKFKVALAELSKLGIKNVLQGDLMFTDDVETTTIDGEKYYTFQPNTIVYAVPVSSDLGKTISKSKIGIVWHTTYTGNTFETMKASYGVNVSALKKSRFVWSQDAMLRDVTNATMTKRETEDVQETLKDIGILFNQISGSTLRQLESNAELAQTIETFNNTYVRAGQVIGDTTKHTEKLIRYIQDKYQKEIDKRKTEKGKGAQAQKRDQLLQFFSPKNKANLVKMFELQKLIVLAKMKLINKLNRLQSIDTFVKTRNGFKVTGAEGYVAIDKLGGDAVKLVDRMEFSYNNFSPDILKGWDSTSRS